MPINIPFPDMERCVPDTVTEKCMQIDKTIIFFCPSSGGFEAHKPYTSQRVGSVIPESFCFRCGFG
jgi:hypothetical protein